MEKELVLGDQGAGSQRSPVLGVPCIHRYRRTTKFDVVTRVGEGHVSSGQPRLPSQESGVSGFPNFGGFLYLCLHPLTPNDQIRHGNTYGKGHIF